MEPVVSLVGVGIRFLVPRHSRLGRTPRMLGIRKYAVWGIKDVSFEIAPGEAVGVIGPNGAGKTTLLRTIAGVYQPDEGRLAVRGRVGPLLSLQAGMMHQLSGWENIMLAGVLLGLPKSRVAELSPQIAEFSGLGDFLDAEVRTYSSGMRARLGFSVAVFTDPDLLVLDEILMVGDEEFREQSFGLVTRFLAEGKPLLLASHDLDHLQELSNRVIYLEGGRVVTIGEPASVIQRYRDEHHGPKGRSVTRD